MLRQTAGIFTSKVRSFFDNKSYGFERFHNDDSTESIQKMPKEATELSSLSNGSAGCLANGFDQNERRKGSTASSEKAEFSHVEEGEEFNGKHGRNRITAWQAGWNVTNAIQVRFVYFLLYQNKKVTGLFTLFVAYRK